MTEWRGAAGTPGPAGQPYPGAAQAQAPVPVERRRAPSGLFPSGPPRPTYREPHPVRALAVGTGFGSTMLWLILAGVLTRSARSYVWATLLAGFVAAAVSLILARFGDRGVAVGVALASGIGVTVAMSVVAVRWIGGQWLLW